MNDHEWKALEQQLEQQKDVPVYVNTNTCPRCGGRDVLLNPLKTLAVCQQRMCAQAWSTIGSRVSDTLAAALELEPPPVPLVQHLGEDSGEIDHETPGFKIGIGLQSIVHPNEPGAKGDAGKQPVDRGVFSYWPRTMLALAEVSRAGAMQEGRDWGGQMQVPNGFQRYLDAHGRHVLRRYIDGEVDPDSGSLHILAAAWSILTACEIYLKERDDKSPTPRQS